MILIKNTWSVKSLTLSFTLNGLLFNNIFIKRWLDCIRNIREQLILGQSVGVYSSFYTPASSGIHLKVCNWAFLVPVFPSSSLTLRLFIMCHFISYSLCKSHISQLKLQFIIRAKEFLTMLLQNLFQFFSWF